MHDVGPGRQHRQQLRLGVGEHDRLAVDGHDVALHHARSSGARRARGRARQGARRRRARAARAATSPARRASGDSTPATVTASAHTGPTQPTTTRAARQRLARRSSPMPAARRRSANQLRTAGPAVNVTAWTRPAITASASRSAGPRVLGHLPLVHRHLDHVGAGCRAAGPISARSAAAVDLDGDRVARPQDGERQVDRLASAARVGARPATSSPAAWTAPDAFGPRAKIARAGERVDAARRRGPSSRPRRTTSGCRGRCWRPAQRGRPGDDRLGGRPQRRVASRAAACGSSGRAARSRPAARTATPARPSGGRR